MTSAGSAEADWAEASSGRGVGGVEGAADAPETAGSWPVAGSAGVVEASVIVHRSYCVDRSGTMKTPSHTPALRASTC